MKFFLLTILALMLIVNSGCKLVSNSMRDSEKISRWNPIEAMKPVENEDEEAALPQTMAAIWNFGVYEKPGSPSIRGLGGRIYFYDSDSNAVTAKGKLIVYGFDEESGSKTQPDKKFVFRNAEFQTHYSDSPLGGSYSVWIPWDEVGGYRKSVTLIPIFKTEDGRVLKSGQSISLLAGRVRKTAQPGSEEPYKVLGSSSAVLGNPTGDSERNRKSNGVTRAAFTEPTGGEASDGNSGFHQRIRTTEIPLTPNLQRQIDISQRLRAGEKVFPGVGGNEADSKVKTAPDQATTVEGSLDVGEANAAEAVETPATRTATKAGVFGAPGSFR
jgi:hypothetical protein